MSHHIRHMFVTLRKTRQILEGILTQMFERGMATEEIETKSIELLGSSQAFEKKVVPWYTRWYRYIFRCPGWWFRCSA